MTDQEIEKPQTKPATIGDMTRDELKALIREVLEDMLWSIEQAYAGALATIVPYMRLITGYCVF